MRHIIKPLVAVLLLIGALSAYGQNAVISTDTITQEKPLKKFERDIEKTPFIPKGQWITSLSVNYSQQKADQYQFLIIEGISGDNYSFKVSPMFAYAFKNDLAVGGRFSYKRTRTRIDSADVKLSSKDSFGIKNFYSINQSFQGTLLLRNYMPLGHGKRFGIINEVQLNLEYGESKLVSGTGAELSGSFEKTFSAGIGISPGIMMFLSNYRSIEVNVGVLGLDFSHSTQTSNQVYVAKRHSTSANLRINLFSISFGVAFYI